MIKRVLCFSILTVFCVFGFFNHAHAALTDNLSAYWKLDEASGTRVDSAGSNDLTSNNSVGQAVGKLGNAS